MGCGRNVVSKGSGAVNSVAGNAQRRSMVETGAGNKYNQNRRCATTRAQASQPKSGGDT